MTSTSRPHPVDIPFWGKISGFLLFFLLLGIDLQSFGHPWSDLKPAGQRMLAVTTLMGLLWLTNAIPMAATSLIPLLAFPLLGIQSSAAVSKAYIDQNVFLFLGGFIIALGIEKWGLHRRMALHVVHLLGTSQRMILLGFMLATAFMSMWISNTASTLLMLPIGLALLKSLDGLTPGDTLTPAPIPQDATPRRDRFGVVLMLGIAYSASIGGLTTLVGTTTNLAFRGIYEKSFPSAPSLSASGWMASVVPLGAVYVLCTWLILSWKLEPKNATKIDRSIFANRLKALGAMSRGELLMLIVFVVTAALWIFRVPLDISPTQKLPGWRTPVANWLMSSGMEQSVAEKYVDDSTVAMGMAVVMFFIPVRRNERGEQEYLMDWQAAERLPWGILLLIGGGFALAGGFEQTGVSAWLGKILAEFAQGMPLVLVVAMVCLLMTFLTEFTSNVATVSTILPVLAAASLQLEVDPRLVMIPATISASCAFMLPIATPPNAIVFGSDRVRMTDMIRYGILLNFLGVILVTIATFLLLTTQMEISTSAGLPDWARPAAMSSPE